MSKSAVMEITMWEWFLFFMMVVVAAYGFYQVWFRPVEVQRYWAEMYTEESRTARALASSRLGLWFARTIVTTMMLALLYLLVWAVYAWAETN